MAEVGDDVLVAQSDWTAFFEELKDETDRGCAILAVAWIDHLLERRLGAHFSGGNSDARRKLFDANGPFSPFSAKVTAAFCLGWLDADLRHDLDVIRKIRNRFAHQIHGLTLDDPDMAILVDSFRLPHREFSDWGQLRCAAKADGSGIVLYTGDPPEDLGEELSISRNFVYRWAVSIVVAYVAASLDVGVVVTDDSEPDARK